MTLRSFWWNEIKDLMARIKMHIPKAKLPFYLPCEVKCKLQNRVSTAVRTVHILLNPQLPNPHCFIKVPLNTHSVYRSDPRHLIKVLMTVHLIRWNARNVPLAGEEALAPIGEQDSTGHDIGPRTSKSSSPSEEPGSRILRGYCGAEGFGKAQPISYQA